jgi:hypothetical protein
MESKLIIVITVALSVLSTTQISADPYSAKATKDRQGYKEHVKKVNNYPKANRPTYYRGHSDGLQNYPGKTIDAGMNTGMLPTNSASHSGNDVTF